MDFEIQFSDLTLLEANGNYEDVCAIMKVPHSSGIIKDIVVDKWMIESLVTLQNPFGFSQLSCHFYWDGRIIIADYTPTIQDIHNPDIRCLTYWANLFGWKRPEPLPTMVDTWMDFWHMQWDTFIVDSEYLETIYGKREDRSFFEDENEETDVL